MKMFSSTTRIIDLTLGEFAAFLEEKWNALKPHSKASSATKQSEFMNVAECAAFTGYKPGYIRQLVFYNKIPYYKTRKPLKFKRSEIVEWMKTECKRTIEKLATDYINNNPLTTNLKKRNQNETK